VGSIGGAELVLILLLALLLFGPRRLPQIGRTLGKALGDLRKATTDFKTNLEREVDLEQVKDLHGDIKSARREVSDAVSEFRDLGRPPARNAADRLPPRKSPARPDPDDDRPTSASAPPDSDDEAGPSRDS
jgi:Tat protein translocase TatB subunit